MTRTVPDDRPPATGPLAGLRVLELGSVVAGPFAGRLLGDYGADVIKIEAPERPDPMRDWGQESYRGHRLWWTSHARNKRCITLDLRHDRGRDLLLDLVGRTDVVVENFRPGTLERWHLGWERLHTANPGLVLARISGYGQTGPDAHKPGYASVAEARSGLRSLNGYPGEAPPRQAISLGDSLAGMFAVQGILAALFHRERTGEGQVVDVALTESCFALLESTVAEYDRLGRVRGPGGTRLDGIAPSNVYRTADEQWLVVAANQDTVFGRLCAAMGRDELATDPRYVDHVARGEHQDELDGIVAAWVGSLPAETVRVTLDEAGVICGPINTAAELVSDPQLLARGMLVTHHDERVDDDVLGPGVVPLFSATPGQVRWAGPPRPGHHNDEVYAELGLDPDDLARLAADQVV